MKIWADPLDFKACGGGTRVCSYPMLELLPLVKPLHVLVALASGAGFALRGVWMLRGSPLLQVRVVRVLPHLLDTVLLASGVFLAVALQFSPTAQPWLAAKLLLLLAYIVAGVIALRRGRTRRVRTVAMLVALGCYALIVVSAVTHRPLGLPPL